MAKAELVASFDYESVDKETKGKLIHLAGQVKRNGTDFIKSVVEIGEAIHIANELLAGQRKGAFKSWVECETGLSERTAYDWMNVYTRSLDFAIIAKTPPTVAYLLSGPNVPDAAIEDFEKQIGKGTRPTVAAAKATLERYKPKVAKVKKPRVPKVNKVRSQSDEPSNGAPDSLPVVAAPAEETAFDPAVIESTPPKGIDIAALSEPYRLAVNDLNRIRRDMRKLADDESTGAHLVEKINRIEKAIDDAKTPIAQATPTAICGKCDGKKCPKCSNTGWWPKSVVEGLKK